MSDQIKIRILDWEKYNPRKDVNSSSWFRFQHDFFEDPNFYNLTAEERLVWVYLLCERSKRKVPPQTEDYFTVNTAHAHRVAGINTTVLMSGIKKLEQEQILTVRTLRGRYVDVTRTCSTNDTYADVTGRNGTNERNTVPKAQEKTPTEERANAPRLRARKTPKSDPINGKVWEAYSGAYFARYGTEPVRNAAVNSQVAQIVKRLGVDAPHVVAHFLRQGGFYASRHHAIGLCLKDAEALRTQWVTGTNAPQTVVSKNDQLAETVRLQREMIERGEL